MPIAVTTVVKDTFGSVFSNTRYKILCMDSCRLFYDSSRHRLRHRPSPTMRLNVFHSTHGPRRRRASLSHLANERRTCYRFFDFWPWGAYPCVKGHQKGRWPTVHLDLPSYKISARSRKRCSRYALPKLFSLWRWFLTPQGHPRSNVTVPIESPWVLRLSAPRGPTSYLSPFSRYFESKFWLLTLWPWPG